MANKNLVLGLFNGKKITFDGVAQNFTDEATQRKLSEFSDNKKCMYEETFTFYDTT